MRTISFVDVNSEQPLTHMEDYIKKLKWNLGHTYIYLLQGIKIINHWFTLILHEENRVMLYYILRSTGTDSVPVPYSVPKYGYGGSKEYG